MRYRRYTTCCLEVSVSSLLKATLCDGEYFGAMQESEEVFEFTQDPPFLVALVMCDAVALTFVANRLSLLGLFDVVVATQFPMPVIGSLVAIFSGVRERFQCTFEAVGYTNENPLGVRQEVGKAIVEVPQLGSIATVFVSGTIIFPIARVGTADLRVSGNGTMLGSRPVTIIQAPGASA